MTNLVFSNTNYVLQTIRFNLYLLHFRTVNCMQHLKSLVFAMWFPSVKINSNCFFYFLAALDIGQSATEFVSNSRDNEVSAEAATGDIQGKLQKLNDVRGRLQELRGIVADYEVRSNFCLSR